MILFFTLHHPRKILLALYYIYRYIAIEERVSFLEFRRYDDIDIYKADVFEILLEDEVYNNLPIGILTGSDTSSRADWFLATVVDKGKVVLTALCTKPFNLLLYETKNKHRDGAVEFLAHELRRTGYSVPGVTADRVSAERFAGAYACDISAESFMSLVLMRLDKLADYSNAPGFCRMLEENDISFIPSWENAFCEDCRVPIPASPGNIDRIKSRLGKDTHFIWEDGVPVSQAVYGRDTPTGAVINWVYTPPRFRGRGYATSVVAELSKRLLSRGKDFCCLFADAGNPLSRKVYQRLGYYDVCEFEDIRFDTKR